MGTIPAPNIVEAAGQIAQAPLNRFAEYQRAAQLKQQVALEQQQTQSADLANQKSQLELTDAQAMTKAMHDWDGKDMDALPDLVRKSGGSFGAYQAAQKHVIDRKTALATLDKDQLANLSGHHDAALGVLDSAKEVPDEELSTHISDSVQQLQAQGHLSPSEAQQVATHAQSMPPDQFRPWLDVYEKGLRGEKAIIEENQKKRELDIKAQEANEKDWKTFPELGLAFNTRTGEQKPVAGAGGAPLMTPGMMEAKYVSLSAKKSAGQPLAPEDAAFMKGYKDYKTLVPVANFNLQAAGVNSPAPPTTDAKGEPLSFDDQVKTMGAKGGVVKAIIEGRQTPPASFAQKTPYWQDVMQKVYSLDPEFNEQRAQLRKGYTVGQQSKEINAINTAMGHVGVLGDAIDALNNSDVRVLNKIANRLGLETGSTPAAVFKTIVHRVGPELSKAYLGAGGSAGERGADEKDFDENLPGPTLKANVGITSQLLRSKIGALENQWDENKAPSMKSFEDQFISKEAKTQLDKWSPKENGGAKVATQQHVAAYAKAKNISVAQATSEFKASGYTVK